MDDMPAEMVRAIIVHVPLRWVPMVAMVSPEWRAHAVDIWGGRVPCVPPDAMDHAARRGLVSMALWLHNTLSHPWSARTAQKAVLSGHIDFCCAVSDPALRERCPIDQGVAATALATGGADALVRLVRDYRCRIDSWSLVVAMGMNDMRALRTAKLLGAPCDVMAVAAGLALRRYEMVRALEPKHKTVCEAVKAVASVRKNRERVARADPTAPVTSRFFGNRSMPFWKWPIDVVDGVVWMSLDQADKPRDDWVKDLVDPVRLLGALDAVCQPHKARCKAGAFRGNTAYFLDPKTAPATLRLTTPKSGPWLDDPTCLADTDCGAFLCAGHVGVGVALSDVQCEHRLAFFFAGDNKRLRQNPQTKSACCHGIRNPSVLAARHRRPKKKKQK
ncbi:hypothetical protein pneo_cds_1072 [Pandoravirus neocaledonia]|uniref:F-box domain containing protein n=1 Tax=Pandoravirus neocaledonia TaxID=2107708 RepID=A0A2U7UDY4_9VIRU|nr:hypothetical protein pneo_cds_1072 [Pandoravirus neocaledonia]AVK76679.1 hypothetical protein pneo_cds_1072 [Pandoravirus neocaledonia]